VTALWIEELSSKPVIRPRRWAELAEMPASTVYDAIKNGTLPSIRLGAAIYIPTAPLLELLGISPENDEGAPRFLAEVHGQAS
jgi:hypothetical protein